MTENKKPVINRALVRRVCCDYRNGDATQGNANKAHWELCLVVYNTTDTWPSEAWPVSRRHKPPTITERTEALARLGYTPAPGATWEWQETEEPTYHGHPASVSFIASISVVPLKAEDGDS
ncbi:DUF6303 family protein [Streptomyces europaeiscabiei]|uniref:DUF6303 family protein n=1 Tax=Streptomyces europaeiscabiei TaxID=146819 RepID=UPI0029B9345A|nr:DUF6303 family protein [Streptomyces europaeiscabiei]MDX3634286.1 DUF6303 family protein [Streptomyces europaeiscabiei]MDX3651866.1 DUF6303 family protein [Streptomyces europaeiscabiei]